jgi:hypothetical protein
MPWSSCAPPLWGTRACSYGGTPAQELGTRTGRGWQRLKEQHPEVEELVVYVRFPDKIGRLHKDPTPVVDLGV